MPFQPAPEKPWKYPKGPLPGKKVVPPGKIGKGKQPPPKKGK